MPRRLPDAFAELERFVDAWALPSETARSRKRLASTMDEIQAFYDAMLPKGEAILAHLAAAGDPATDADLSEETRTLFRLMLSLAEVAPAVEIFRQPGVIDGLEAARFVPDHESADWKAR